MEQQPPAAAQAKPELFTQALAFLFHALQPFLPLDRAPGKHQFHGVELVHQDRPGQPFSASGLLVCAANELQRLGPLVTNQLNKRIAQLSQSNQFTPINAKNDSKADGGAAGSSEFNELVEKTKPHLPPAQPINTTSTSSGSTEKRAKFTVRGCGQNNIFISEVYLRRIELENMLYRHHLSLFEERVRERMLKEICETFGLGGGKVQNGRKKTDSVGKKVNGAAKAARGRGNTNAKAAGVKKMPSTKTGKTKKVTKKTMLSDEKVKETEDADVIMLDSEGQDFATADKSHEAAKKRKRASGE